jgi:hypothetical protein
LKLEKGQETKPKIKQGLFKHTLELIIFAKQKNFGKLTELISGGIWDIMSEGNPVEPNLVL